MNFAIPFTRKFKYFSQDVQININYKPEIKKLDNFLSQYGSHRVNLYIDDFNSLRDNPILEVLFEKYPKIVVSIPYYTQEIEQSLNEIHIPHYYTQVITNGTRFLGFLSLNVTDITIGEDLAFSAKFLSKKAKEKGISLRTFCNVCQTSWYKETAFKTFFIRPEDIDLYEGIIDTFEFYFATKEDIAKKVNPLYEIYTKDKKWFGKLNEIIVYFNDDYDSRFILPYFGSKRLDCGKRCTLGYSCNMCKEIMDLSRVLKDKKKIVVIDKK